MIEANVSARLDVGSLAAMSAEQSAAVLEGVAELIAQPARATCRWCGRQTSNPWDIMERYCSCCGGPYLPKGCAHRTHADIDEGAW